MSEAMFFALSLYISASLVYTNMYNIKTWPDENLVCLCAEIIFHQKMFAFSVERQMTTFQPSQIENNNGETLEGTPVQRSN